MSFSDMLSQRVDTTLLGLDNLFPESPDFIRGYEELKPIRASFVFFGASFGSLGKRRSIIGEEKGP